MRRTDPYSQGLPRDVVTRLLIRTHTEKDRKAYYKTAHFRSLRKSLVEIYFACVLCDEDRKDRLTAHHRHYRTLFQEDRFKDVTLVCQRCHKRHHRK